MISEAAFSYFKHFRAHNKVTVINIVAHLSTKTLSCGFKRSVMVINRIQLLAFEIHTFRQDLRIYQDSCLMLNYFNV